MTKQTTEVWSIHWHCNICLLLFLADAIVIDQSTSHRNVDEMIFVFIFHFKLTKFSQCESFFLLKLKLQMQGHMVWGVWRMNEWKQQLSYAIVSKYYFVWINQSISHHHDFMLDILLELKEKNASVEFNLSFWYEYCNLWKLGARLDAFGFVHSIQAHFA